MPEDLQFRTRGPGSAGLHHVAITRGVVTVYAAVPVPPGRAATLDDALLELRYRAQYAPHPQDAEARAQLDALGLAA